MEKINSPELKAVVTSVVRKYVADAQLQRLELVKYTGGSGVSYLFHSQMMMDHVLKNKTLKAETEVQLVINPIADALADYFGNGNPVTCWHDKNGLFTVNLLQDKR